MSSLTDALARATAAAARTEYAALTGDCVAAELAQDDCLEALEVACAASAEVIVSHPGTAESAAARALTREVGDLYARACLAHSRARVAARLAIRGVAS
jgi:ribosomal protein S11